MEQSLHLHTKLARNILEQVFGNIANILKSGKKHNAFFPFILFFFVASVIIFSLIKFVNDKEMTGKLINAEIVLIAFGCLMYLLFYLFKPDRLQSESYLLEDKKLSMIAQKGNPIEINPVDLTPPVSQLNQGGSND